MAEFNPDEYLAEKQQAFDPDAYLSETKGPGVIESIKRGAKDLGTIGLRGLTKAADIEGRYFAAPARAALGQAQKSYNPSDIVKSFISQIGQDQRKAPSGKELLKNAGYSIPDTALSDVAPSLYNETGEGLPLQKGGWADPTASGVAGFAAEVATDPLTYAPLGAIAKGVGKAAEAGEGLIGAAGRKALSVGFDVPEAVSQRYLANPEAVRGAAELPEVGQKLADTLGQVRQKGLGLNEATKATLSSERLPVRGMEMRGALEKLSSIPDKEAAELAQKLEAQYLERSGGVSPQANPDYLTQSEMDEVRQVLQGAGDFRKALNSKEIAKTNMLSREVSRGLKEQNPQYAAAIGDEAKNVRVKNDLAKKFGIIPEYGGETEFGLTTSDRTVPAMKDVIKDNKVERERVLKALQEQGFGNLSEDIQNSMAKSVLEGGGHPNGSRKAVMGGALGGALGHAAGIPGGGFGGAALGSAAGGALDKFGPQIGKQILDASIIAKKISGTAAERFIPLLQQAESRGPEAVATMHYLLSQTEPSFSQAITEPTH